MGQVGNNEDQIFETMENLPGVLDVGPSGGVVELIGSTGECVGIEGQIEILPRPQAKSSKKRTYQGIGVGKVIWKIP